MDWLRITVLVHVYSAVNAAKSNDGVYSDIVSDALLFGVKHVWDTKLELVDLAFVVCKKIVRKAYNTVCT